MNRTPGIVSEDTYKHKKARCLRPGFFFCCEPKIMVPEVGLEPTWALSPLDFESSAYTNFATPAAN